MYENKKRFPQIERIYIADSVMSIRIPNKMFPNVKEIISDSKSFQSGNLLIRKALGACLFNTFCKKTDELIDLNGVETIADNAFDGCESSNIINAGGIKEVSFGRLQYAKQAEKRKMAIPQYRRCIV